MLPDPSFGFDQWLTLKDWHSSWVGPIFDRFWLAAKQPGWNPKIVALGGGFMAIDYCGEPRVIPRVRPAGCVLPWYQLPDVDVRPPSEARIIRYEDHPHLATLPKNAPRAVKAIYTKESLLKYARADDLWVYHNDKRLADEAWAKYTENASNPKR